MRRYNDIQQSKRWDDKSILNTTHYPDIPTSDNDIYIVSNETDCLDALAYKYYNDPTLWFIIALANNIGKGRLSIEPGIQLRIPTNISVILSEYKRLNS